MGKRIQDQETLGYRLKMWRKQLGLNGENFAVKAGLHVGMVRKYEVNLAIPGGEALIAIGNTGLNIHWLLFGVGNMISTSEPSREVVILNMLNELDAGKREIMLNDFFLRIQDAKELKELNETVGKLLESQVCSVRPPCKNSPGCHPLRRAADPH